MTTLTRESITNLLATNDKAVARALVVITANQTADEKVSDSTRHLNGKGWKPCHAYMGTRMAEWYSTKGFLSAKQVAYWRVTDRKGTMRIAGYWRQLLAAAEDKAAAA